MDQPVPLYQEGFETEIQFLTAVVNNKDRWPEWLCGIEQASSFWDVRGIDAFAYIRYPGQNPAEPIPIQIKSSVEGVEKYYLTRPGAAKARVSCLLVRRPMTNGQIWQILYRELEGIRYFRIRYDEYLRLLQSWPLSRRDRLYQACIEELRKQLPEPPAVLPPPRPVSRRRQMLQQVGSFTLQRASM